MSTDTIATSPTAAASERALRVLAAVGDSYDTQRALMERTGLPKTTLIETLKWLVAEGKVAERRTEDRRVFYRVTNAYEIPVRQVSPNPDGRLPRGTVTGMDRLMDAPDPRLAALLARRAGAIVPQQGTPAAQGAPASAPVVPASGRSARLGRGQAEALILAHLAAHPADSFGPYELGRAIAPAGHRPLGVRDACARMAMRGQIIEAQVSPVRYRHNPGA